MQLIKIFFLYFFVCFIANNVATAQPKLLVFYKTTFYYHESIPDGIAAIQKLGRQKNFDVDTINNASAFTDENLDKYAAVVF